MVKKDTNLLKLVDYISHDRSEALCVGTILPIWTRAEVCHAFFQVF